MAKNSLKKTIWQEKKIAPLRWCSLDRATRLLDCEVEDFIHWHNTSRIRLSLDCVVPGELRILSSEDGLLSDANSKSAYYELSRHLDRDGYNFTIEEPKNFEYNVDQYGVLSVPITLDGVVDIDGAIDYAAIVLSKKNLRPHQEINKRGLAIFMGERGELTLKQKKLLITKENIEKIYEAIDSGVFEREVTIQDDIKVESVGGTTKQADFIVGLIKGMGLTDGDLMESVNTIKNKIKSRSKYKDIPLSFSDKTLIDWLRRGGVNR